MSINHTLVHAVIEYDRKQSTKRGYNHYALAIYLGRVEEIIEDIAAGADARSAIVAGFSGRLADACLRSLGLPITTREEAQGGNVCYKPVAKTSTSNA
jgi:hypothetical protein